jgi:hypothetical protein
MLNPKHWNRLGLLSDLLGLFDDYGHSRDFHIYFR